MKKFLVTLLGVAVVLTILFIIANVTFTYSEGSRAGRLIKFAHNGYVFKTYEGEINLGGVTNAANGSMMMNYMWDFSVVDKAVADSLSTLEGRDIRVHYKEKLARLPWRGDTKFIVDKVEEVK
jgi:Phr family secreted Rap phosphatase inhibitor